MKQDVYHNFPKLQKLLVELVAGPTITVVHKFPEPLIIQMREEPKPTLKGGIMFIVKDTQKNVPFLIGGLIVVDAEGHPIPNAKVTPKAISDAPDVVEIIPDPTDPEKGEIHIGAPGVANINVVGVLEDGTELPAPIGAQFTVTLGDPAALSGGTIRFEGIEEAPEPPTP